MEHQKPKPSEDPDLPAESFYVPIEDELDWVDRNAAAAVYDRDDSVRETTNPKSSSSKTTQHHQITTTSHRFGGGSGPFIVLPSLNHHKTTSRQSSECHVLFPKKEREMEEPKSPEVTCMGRVGSKRERNKHKHSWWCCCGRANNSGTSDEHERTHTCT